MSPTETPRDVAAVRDLLAAYDAGTLTAAQADALFDPLRWARALSTVTSPPPAPDHLTTAVHGIMARLDHIIDLPAHRRTAAARGEDVTANRAAATLLDGPARTATWIRANLLAALNRPPPP